MVGVSYATSRISGWNSPWLLTMSVIFSMYSLFLNNSLKGMETFNFESSVYKLKVERTFSTSTNVGCFTSFVFSILFFGSLYTTSSFCFSLLFSVFCWLLEGWIWSNLPLLQLHLYFSILSFFGHHLWHETSLFGTTLTLPQNHYWNPHEKT